LAATAYPLG